jgi:DNA-binding Lrp family transcriptional regulator
MKAYVFLETKPGTSEEVLQYLRKVSQVKGVKQVDSVYGRFDAIVVVEATDLSKLGDLVYRMIEKVPNVTHSETSIVLSTAKEGEWRTYQLAMPVLAYVLVKVKPGTSHEIVASRKIHGVKMANSVFGRYDAVLTIAAKDMAELSKTLYDVIEKHPSVERTECLISIPYPPTEEEAPRHPERFSVISFQCPSCNSLNERGAAFCQFCGYMFNEPRHGIQ